MAKASRRKTSQSKDEASTGDVVRGFSRLHVWQIQAVRDVLFVGAIIAVVWLGYALRAVTVPLLVALLLAYLFEPLIARWSRHPKVTRPMAVGGLLGTVGIIVVLVLALTVPLVIGQTLQLIDTLREESIRDRVVSIESFVRDKFSAVTEVIFPDDDAAPPGGAPETTPPAPPTPDDADEPAGGSDGATPADSGGDDVPALTDERIEAIALAAFERFQREQTPTGQTRTGGDWLAGVDKGNVARGSVHAIARIVGGVVGLGLLTLLIPFYFFFFSLWYPDALEFGRTLLPEKNRDRTLHLLSKMDRVVAGFVRGRIVISLIMGVLLAIGWMLCGVPFALLLGLVIGIFCAVPYLGVVGIPIAIGLLFYDQIDVPQAKRMGWIWIVLWPTVVFSIVQLIEAYVLTPAISGKTTNLDPVTILVAVLAGGSVLGIYGMLLAIPLAACLKIIATEILLPQMRAWARGEVADPLPIDRD